MSRLSSLLARVLKWVALALTAIVVIAIVGAVVAYYTFVAPQWSQFGTKPDEAMAAGRTRATFRAADDEYFVQMDKQLLVKPADPSGYPPSLMRVATTLHANPEDIRKSAVRGQNMWIVWTGGNDRFWDYASTHTAGAFDLLKTVSSYKSTDPRKSMYYGRRNRWIYLGLVNEPCFVEADGPDPLRYGLWLDRREESCPPDPFADASKYPGVKAGARGRTVPVGSYYGEPSGIAGLRLFPNPDFDEAAKAHWDPVRYYDDPSYYNDAKLVRPYRVGMACAFCHVGPAPTNAPADPENPKWENLASNVGAQYYWVDRIFFWNTRPRGPDKAPTENEGNFLYQLFHTNPPGTLDTSLVSTDYLNNPRTMNAVYDTFDRLLIALHTGQETLRNGELNNKQFDDYPLTAPVKGFWDRETGIAKSMRVLKDGSDSVGTLGALNRVYLNIGLFSEEWLLHFRPFVGGRSITPIRIADAGKQSGYWGATEDQTPNMAVFFLATGINDKLAQAPNGKEHLQPFDSAVVNRGKVVFAENCAACHSSKRPPIPANSGVDDGICAGGGAGPDYRLCWDRYRQWTQTPQFKAEMADMVLNGGPDGKPFLEDNYLSNERRVPLDLLQVNACGPLASNALAGDIWDNFSSSTYKTLPAVKPITVYHPVSGAPMSFQPLGNGRGYLRPASLIALWSTAPYLLNNSVGHSDPAPPKRNYAAAPGSAGAQYAAAGTASDANSSRGEACPSDNPANPDLPCVENRLNQFETSIKQMLYPERRRRDPVSGAPGYIYRTTAPTCLRVPAASVPSGVRRAAGLLHWLAPWAIQRDGGIALGPLPKDFPINALTNTKLLPDNDEGPALEHLWTLARATPTILSAFSQLGGMCSAQQLADPATQVQAERVVRQTGLIDTLMSVSKCPDYVVNRGHYFGANLPDDDKDALIEYLKYF
jgi:mono/diheme cytochrome c family protein